MLFVRSIRIDSWALVRSWIAKLSYVNREHKGVVFHQGRSHTNVNCATKALPRSASWCSTAGCTMERRSLTNVMSATCSLQPRATWRSTPGKHKWDPANAYPWVYLNRNVYSGVSKSYTFTWLWHCYSFSLGASLTMPNGIIAWMYLLIREEICAGWMVQPGSGILVLNCL